MKKITDAQRIDIEDASTAGLLGHLPPAIAEKDIHVTDALLVLSRVQAAHTARLIDPRQNRQMPAQVPLGSQLVFAGGTCLSKAHGLIQRMSEDIDIKIVLEPVPAGYTSGQSERARLRGIHQQISADLHAIGFQLVDSPDNPETRDNRRYHRMDFAYQPVFRDIAGTLRPELKVELNHGAPLLPAVPLEMGYLFDRLVGRADTAPLTIPCVSVAETLAEKVLSLLRRCAWFWAGEQRGEFDRTLVRHIYDVWRIYTLQPATLAAAVSIFDRLVSMDVDVYGAQNPPFAERPYQTLQEALQRASSDAGLQQDFQQRLLPLLYGDYKPSYQECFAVFRQVADQLLAAR